MRRERVLITVKTYPSLSASYIELVCTAGLREDGSWVRIYPVPFRLMGEDQQFAKWTWVELPLERRTKDKRPESYSPADRNDITIGSTIGTADNWRERRDWIFKRTRVWKDLAALIAAGKRDEVSLATFRPSEMLGFEFEAAEPDLDAEKLAQIELRLRQMDMLEPDTIRENFKPAQRLPYNFYYRFKDDKGKTSRLRILDWEIGMLYWNCLKASGGDSALALKKVRHRYESDFFQKDLHLFLGTTHEWHSRAPNPWIIIGVFPAPKVHQMELF
jgi:hypothetical protein